MCNVGLGGGRTVSSNWAILSRSASTLKCCWHGPPYAGAKFLHCVRTACILRTQRLGYLPKNTCHLSSSTAKQQSPHENNETAFNLPTLNMSFFHKVQLGQTQNPCFLTPLQCFVQWQGKAHMPTLNMPFFHKVQLVQTPDD